MKTALAITVLALLVWLGWHLARPAGELPSSATAPESIRTKDPPGTVIRDGAEVFRKAFWKRPTDDDRILHAERRVWSDGEGVEKWQWFLVAEPSPALTKYLRDDNTFSLPKASTPTELASPPSWFAFPPGEIEILRSADGSMQLCFARKGELLFASAAGRGFTKAWKEGM